MILLMLIVDIGFILLMYIISALFNICSYKTSLRLNAHPLGRYLIGIILYYTFIILVWLLYL